ncbi:MAG: hypothetical protein L3K26_18065, partial [Candidatus Hydrogenedentes bacterium]|nr:hypothetical protein [Candidatus Hydrogenedentota bacterium]
MPTEPTKHIATALPSVRGLVLATNTQGTAVGQTTLRQWLRLSTEKFKAQKVDLYLPCAETDVVLPLLEEAAHLGLRLSLRCANTASPAILKSLAARGLFDVALEPTALDVQSLDGWLDAAEQAKLPVRLFINAASIPDAIDSDLLAVLARSVTVQITLRNDLTPPAASRALPDKTLARIITLAEALRERGCDLYCVGIPFCQLPESLWPTVANTPQQLTQHAFYRPSAFGFAYKLRNLNPDRIHQAVEITLSEGGSFHNRIDDAVLPWILERPRFFFWLWFLHKLTRRLPLRRAKAKALSEELPELETRLAAYQQVQRENLGPECARCAFHPICDHHTEAFKQAFPGRGVQALPGEPHHDPHALFSTADAWHDAIDAERCLYSAQRTKLAEIARNRIARERPTREIAAESYCIQDHKTHRMPASIRWFSFSTAELQSTVLATLSPPFTLSITIGGGIAQLMGFAFGRHARLLCPMTAYDHKLTLHVDGNGHYVLLRDDACVNPIAFTDSDQVPERIGSIVKPRIALVNIDGQIVTQTVLLWEGDSETTNSEGVQHSVIIVCSRYARRLQAALMALAQQSDIASGALEVIVGYVPGIDATDDVLGSISGQVPDIRLARMPFAV